MAERHIVLVHGAWQGSWAFEAWKPLLVRRGWKVHAVDLPGNGWSPHDGPATLDGYTEHVGAVLRSIPVPAVVLGHSGGGITASQVAEAWPERVAALVYLAGMMLPTGMGYADLAREAAREAPGEDFGGIMHWLDWDAARAASTVRPEGARRCFLQDADPDVARRAAGLLRPQPESGRAMVNRLTRARFGRVSRVYVECRDDRSVFLALQRRMQHLSPGAMVLSMDCGHVPQLVQPTQLTERLMPELEMLLSD